MKNSKIPIKIWFIIAILSLIPSLNSNGFAQKKNNVRSKQTKPTQTKSLEAKEPSETSSPIESVDSNEASSQVENRVTASPLDRILKNQIFASGLASGADAINRSLATLMESLFYNLMDTDIRHGLTGNADVGIGVNRDVFQTDSGAWVVIDRFGIGPGFSKELYRYNDVPVNLGASQSSDVYDIYLRTDPMRVGENKKLPFWRVAVNNWFGVLPILEAVLPPSFNPNEMYDPLRRIESPFTFPLSISSVDGMEVGTIKSYAINGGINVGIESSEGIKGFRDQVVTGPSAIETKLPYTVFRTGQYRINVLKRSLTNVWVGVSDSSRTGHRIETKIGRAYYLLSKTVPLWTGLATPIFPLDFSLEEAIADLFSRVYEFDLRNNTAQSAYLEAVHGNLAPAQIAWLRAREDHLETGVTFFHTKKEKRYETKIDSGHNVFLFNRKTNRTHADSEIEITDKDGKFYVLEARQDQNQTRWDMLTGVATKSFSNVADLKVRKVLERTDIPHQIKSRYEFVADPNPVDLTMSFQVIDKFVETEDLVEYLDLLGRFSNIDLFDEVPTFRMRDESLQTERRKRIAFDTDLNKPVNMHITPTHLGSFEGYAALRMDMVELNRIAELPSETLWLRLCDAFAVFEQDCETFHDSLFRRNIDRLKGWSVLPFRLVDIRFPRFDAMDEIENTIQSLRSYQKASNPESKRDYLRKLFATEHPLEVTQGLLSLANENYIPRIVRLVTKPKGNGKEAAKDAFQKMDGLRIRRGPKMPEPARYDTTVETDSKFNPENLSFLGVKPGVKKLLLTYTNVKRENLFSEKPEDQASTAKSETPKELNLQIQVNRFNPETKFYVYIKMEQTGKVQLAKFKLIEQVAILEPSTLETILGSEAVKFNFPVLGPNSTIANLVANEAMNLGGAFRITVAVSPDNQSWSNEHHIDFSYDNNILRSN
ncbi:MAG: hypothetical protein NT027_15500 [Proteobacteria bacterium]|nr:hypothetical protein [Pseudomonadota bacterium]